MAAQGRMAGRNDRGPNESSQDYGCVRCLGHGGGLSGIHMCHRAVVLNLALKINTQRSSFCKSLPGNSDAW